MRHVTKHLHPWVGGMGSCEGRDPYLQPRSIVSRSTKLALCARLGTELGCVAVHTGGYVVEQVIRTLWQ
jgi:hypothetical protein